MNHRPTPQSKHQDRARSAGVLGERSQCHRVPHIPGEGMIWIVLGVENPIAVESPGRPSASRTPRVLRRRRRSELLVVPRFCLSRRRPSTAPRASTRRRRTTRTMATAPGPREPTCLSKSLGVRSVKAVGGSRQSVLPLPQPRRDGRQNKTSRRGSTARARRCPPGRSSEHELALHRGLSAEC